MKPTVKKSLKLLTLLISSVLIATASALAYVTLQWTTTATVGANPKVCFGMWNSDEKLNTFSYSVTIFPSITTVDENITHYLYNWDSSAHKVSIRWASLSNPENIAGLNLTIYNAQTKTRVYSKVWESVPSFPTDWMTVDDALEPGKYAIAIRITAASGAEVSSISTFMFEIKVDGP